MNLKIGYVALVFLMLALVPSFVSAEPKQLISKPQQITYNLIQSAEVDSLTLTTNNGYDVDLEFIALNPSEIPMPISSVVGFNIRIEPTTNGFKWSYDLNLPHSSFKAKIRVSSPIPITILEGKYVVVDGVLISFDDVLAYDYSYTLNQISPYVAEYEITKDYGSHGISPNDPIIIDPSITAYPVTDGYLRRNVADGIDTFLSDVLLYAGKQDNPGDDYVYRAYMKFDTSQIDSYDTIINATLRIELNTIEVNVGEDCYAHLQSIDDYGDLGISDWNVTYISINATWIDDDWTTGTYQEDVTNYIEKDGVTAFSIVGTVEEYANQDCNFQFDSNETINSPELEIWYEDGSPPSPTELFNYTLAELVYEEASCVTGITEPKDPKIACESDGDSCVAIFYDNSVGCLQALKYSVSMDDFQTIDFHGTVHTTSYSASQFLNKQLTSGHQLPYDIVWDDATNHYYIAVDNKVLVIPAFDPQVFGVSPYRVTDGYTTVTGEFIGEDMSFDCCVEAGYKVGTHACPGSIIESVAFADGDATKLFGTFQARPYKSTVPVDWDGWFGWFQYDVTNQTTDRLDCTELYSNPSCSAAGTLAIDYWSAIGFYSNAGAWRYRIDGQFDFCTGQSDVGIIQDNLASPQNEHNQMYFGGNLYYRNTTLRQMFRSESSDLISFATPEYVYGEDLTVSEVINQSDADASTGIISKNYYIFQRSSTSTDNGIYVQVEETYPIHISSNRDLFATLTCEDFTSTGSGKIFDLSTTCLTGNTITFVSAYTPQVETFDFDVGTCDTIVITTQYADSPYDFTFTVRDALTLNNLAGVNMSLSYESDQTTGSNGQAVFNIQPIGTPSFSVQSGTCSYSLTADGTPLTYYLEASRTDYATTIDTFIPATKIGTAWSFDDNELITLFPSGVVLNVRAFTQDGQEITVSTYNASVTGNNDLTYTFRNNNPVLRNWNRNIPAQFLLYDNRTTYNITVSLDYIVGTDSQTLEVTQDTTYNVYFYLPFTLLDLPCSSIDDCVDDFCDSSGFHHKLSGCVDNICQYVTTDCFTPDLCDTLVGCYQVGTNVSCTNDNDCLYDSNVTTCIDQTTMYVGFCGEDNLCKQKEQTCTTFCNETIGYCNEKADCFTGVIERIGYEWEGGSIYVDAFCDFTNAGETFCISMGEIVKQSLTQDGYAITDVHFSHEGFLIIDTGDTYKISDVVFSCSSTCEPDIEFCSSGECSVETNECLVGGTSWNISAGLYNLWVWFSGLIPLELRLLVWALFTLISMGYYKIKTGKDGVSNDQTTLLVGAVMFIAGISLGWIHWVFLLILGAIISLLIANKIGQ